MPEKELESDFWNKTPMKNSKMKTYKDFVHM